MHGRPRKPLTPEEVSASAVKAEKLRSLQSQFLYNHSNEIYSKEAVELSAKLLEINPESYTAWNYRKLAVEYNLRRCVSGSESTNQIFEDELRVVEIALRQNFKSYGAWYHRKWVVGKGQSSVDKEMRLLDKFQSLDSRNFHAWNYRRFVAELMARSDEDELEYTKLLIDNNFSNYSAWHNRSVILSDLMRKHAKGFEKKEEVLTSEFDYVRGAIFTDEDDQSGWFYHLWLLDQTVRSELPVLVSSWPADGSDILLPRDGKTFPLILYFNQAVTGVDSSTVKVESSSIKNEDIAWKHPSLCNSSYSCVWVASLSCLSAEKQSSEGSSVLVSVGNSEGIVSSSGFPFNQSYSLTFALHLLPEEGHPSEGYSEKFSWRTAVVVPSATPIEESALGISSWQAKKEHSGNSSWQMRLVDAEIEDFRLLFDCKIGKLTVARLLEAKDALSGCSNSSRFDETYQIYSDLMNSDPSHTQYYQDMRSLVQLQKITCDAKAIQNYCYSHDDSSSKTGRNPVCLRLNNLSLSRLGSFERLLWVRMLDLSENALRSLQGLEGLQLLSHLNLSKNKITSFTALDPLKCLQFLEVLDISHNQIGAHSVDTTRYLSRSLSQRRSDSIDERFWEAGSFLKDMKLAHLDVRGNPIADHEFAAFLAPLVPAI